MSYERVMRLALEKGFFFPSSEIYSGPAGFWDYGPLGLGLRNKFVDLWRREIIRKDGMLEIDGSQIMPKDVFRASGHIDSFADPVVRCKKCGSIFRADKLVSEKTKTSVTEGSSRRELDTLIRKNRIRCSKCGSELGETKKFNLMLKVEIGGDKEEAYLRPETCQSIFVDFQRIHKVMRGKLPLAIAQFGKSFRNEISPRQSIVRLREFYQCEIEIFFNPNQNKNFQKFKGVYEKELRVCLDGKHTRGITCSELLKKGILPNQMIA
ncbi:MAG: glycine--tRNA ligase, partial [Nitrososphaerales archaeon]